MTARSQRSTTAAWWARSLAATCAAAVIAATCAAAVIATTCAALGGLVACGDREPASRAAPAEPPANPAAPAEPRQPEPDPVFTPPGDELRRLALGPTDELSARDTRIYADHQRFAPIPAPGPSDWLAQHREPGQTFPQFLASEPNRPGDRRTAIYLLPIGPLDPARSPSIDILAEYTRIFFGLPVSVLPRISIGATGATTRPRSTGRQLLAPGVLAYLRRHLPRDAYCLIGLTQMDLYPEPSWNFVFGQAMLRDRVGVYSFARYHPAFAHGAFGDDSANAAIADDAADHVRSTILSRSLKIMAHEIGHMFGIEHCTWFSCVMNGSNHQTEADSQPHHLCPVDLRKLAAISGFDPVARYRALARFYRAHGLETERAWAAQRLADIARGPR